MRYWVFFVAGMIAEMAIYPFSDKFVICAIAGAVSMAVGLYCEHKYEKS